MQQLHMMRGLARNAHATRDHEIERVCRIARAKERFAGSEAARDGGRKDAIPNNGGQAGENALMYEIHARHDGHCDPLISGTMVPDIAESAAQRMKQGSDLATTHGDFTMRFMVSAAVAVLVTSATSLLSQSAPPKQAKKTTDTAFVSMQERGKKAMGVDQYTSTHKFDSFPDGGRIELQHDTDDSVAVAAIRDHIREIATAFKSGDFSTPAFVHMQSVPGTKKMAALRSKITYTAHNLPRGAELHISTKDTSAVAAIHEFMAFQRGEHHAMGASHP
jgi:hypothetical protein